MAPADDSSNFGRFVAEMRRRHVVRFALGYAAAAFVVLQLAEIVLPAFGLGEGALRAVVVVTALGFPPALVLAWVYDITTDGIRRTSESPGESAALPRLASATRCGRRCVDPDLRGTRCPAIPARRKSG